MERNESGFLTAGLLRAFNVQVAKMHVVSPQSSDHTVSLGTIFGR